MHKIRILCFGKLKLAGYKSLEKEFQDRLSHLASLKIQELTPVAVSPTFHVERALADEAVAIKQTLHKDSITLLLDRSGVERNSLDFAVFLERILSLGRETVFIVGSSHGVSDEIHGLANHKVSLGKLTFPNDLARIMLLEQVYRSFQISTGTSYHK